MDVDIHCGSLVAGGVPETRADVLQKVNSRQHTPEKQSDRHQNNACREQILWHAESAIAMPFPPAGFQGFRGLSGKSAKRRVERLTKIAGLSTKQSVKFRRNLLPLPLLAEELDDHHADSNDENHQRQSKDGQTQPGPSADVFMSAVTATKPPSAR